MSKDIEFLLFLLRSVPESAAHDAAYKAVEKACATLVLELPKTQAITLNPDQQRVMMARLGELPATKLKKLLKNWGGRKTWPKGVEISHPWLLEALKAALEARPSPSLPGEPPKKAKVAVSGKKKVQKGGGT